MLALCSGLVAPIPYPTNERGPRTTLHGLFSASVRCGVVGLSCGVRGISSRVKARGCCAHFTLFDMSFVFLCVRSNRFIVWRSIRYDDLS